MEAVMYSIFEGKVVHGTETGRTLGFPTANVESVHGNFPQDGVYIVQIQIDNLFYYGIMSIGNRPTFDSETKTIEIYLLNFSGDLYQKMLSITPLSFIRDNKKFENPDLLKQQLQQDKDFALQYIKSVTNLYNKKMKSIAIFCGSRMGENPVYKEVTYQLGRLLAQEKITLVYGSGGIGLMGVLADAVLEHQGRVIGVIPRFFNEKEVGHDKISETIWVDSLSDRKTEIARLADGFITLPGGFGSLDELFEILVYSQLNLHTKPAGILNINHFYDPLLFQLEKMKNEGFLYNIHHDMLLVEQSPAELLDKMKHFAYVQNQDWIRKITK